MDINRTYEMNRCSSIYIYIYLCRLFSYKQVPETSIRNSPAYKTIQSQYSVLMMEHQQLRACYEEAKKLLNTAKTQHVMQLEEIR